MVELVQYVVIMTCLFVQHLCMHASEFLHDTHVASWWTI